MFLIFSVFLGIFMGLISYIFGNTLIYLSSYRDSHKYLILFLPFVGSSVYYIYDSYAKSLKKGMKHIKEAYENEININKKLIPFITISTWLSHLFGASVGREGVAVQIGASFSNLTHKYFKIDKNTAILAGMSSGFSGLFGTPISAIFFPIEILHKKNKKIGFKSILVIIFSSFISSYISNKLGLYHFKFYIIKNFNFSINLILLCILSAFIFSVISILFTKLTKKIKIYFSKNIIIIFLLSIILSLILYFFKNGRYAGLGTNLISYSFENNGANIINLDFIYKLFLTSFSLSLFYQGGEVTPLFSIGASSGILISRIFNAPTYLFASIGYIGVFSGCTNTLITPILIYYEVFGISLLPYAILSSVLIYFITNKNSIY